MHNRLKRIGGRVKDKLASFGVPAESTGYLPDTQANPKPTLTGVQSAADSPALLSGSESPPHGVNFRTGTTTNATRDTSPLSYVPASSLPSSVVVGPSDAPNDAPPSVPTPGWPPMTAPISVGDTQSTHCPTVDSQLPVTVAPHPNETLGAPSAEGDTDQAEPLETGPCAQATPISSDSTPVANLASENRGDTTQLTGTPTPPSSLSMRPAFCGATKTWECLHRLQQVLDTAIGFVPFKVAMGELRDIIGSYEEIAAARSEYTILKNELETLFGALTIHFSDDAPLPMTLGMSNLCTAIQRELDHISTKEERGAVRQYREATKDLDDVMACYRRIQGHLERMRLNADLSMWKLVDKQTTEALLKSLGPSMSACYNSAESVQVGRRECTPNTRKQVLADLSYWWRDIKQENMYWLSGMAGTGKTTIASSLCKMLDQSHELGASFFCTRLRPECRDVNLVLPSIAYQLARFCRPFCRALCLSLERDPDLHTKTIPIQLEGLIMCPLRAAAAALPQNLVVVIDALDECDDTVAVGGLLKNLVLYAPDLPLKFFVSSRPEFQIRHNIGDPRAKLILHELEASIVKEDIRLYLETELSNPSVPICDADLSTLVERAGVLFIYAATVVRYIGAATSASRRQRRVQAVLEMTRLGASRTDTHIDALYSAILDSAFDSPDLDEDELANMKLVLDTVICAQEPMTVQALTRILRLGDANLVQDALEPLWSVLHIASGDGLVATLHASFPDYMLDPSRSGGHVCLHETHHGFLAELCFDRIDSNEKQFNICGLESSYVFDEQTPDIEGRIKRNIPEDLFYACRYWAIHLKLGGSSSNRLQRVQQFIADRLLLWMEVLNLKRQMNVGASMIQLAALWCEGEDAPQSTKALVHDAWRFTTVFATNDVSRSTAHLYVSMLATWPSWESLGVLYAQRARGLTRLGGTGVTRRQLALLSVLKETRVVDSIDFSVDGTRIASGSKDGTIQIWDAQTSKLLFDPLRGHTSSVKSVAFSHDGARIVSGSSDKTIRVWDARAGKPVLGPLEGHTGSVLSVAFSYDGMRIVSGSDDSTVRLWDARTGKSLLSPFKGHTGSINSVTFSPDGTRIASGSNDNIRTWDAQTGELLLYSPETFEFSDSSKLTIYAVTFSPDGTRIASGSQDGIIWVRDAQTGHNLLEPLQEHTNSVRSVAFSHDGMRLVSGSRDKTIRVWDAQTGGLLLNLHRGHTDSVNWVAFTPNARHVISGSRDNTIRLWDAQTSNSPLEPLEGHTGSVRSVAFSHDGMQVVSGSYDQTIRAWNAQTGESTLDPLEGHTFTVHSVEFSPDDMRIVSGSSDNTIRVWDAQNGEPLLEPLRGHVNSVKSIAFAPDGIRMASGSYDTTIRVWDTKSSSLLLEPLRGHTEPVNSVAFSPNGTYIASGSDDNTIWVWDAQTGKPLLSPLRGHTASVNSVAFSPDGTRIVSGSDDGAIWMWDAQSGMPLLDPLEGHGGSVYSVAFSPDGMFVVSGCYDKTVQVWNAQTGTPLLDPFKGHTSSVYSVSFSPDGTRIVSGSDDNTIRIWRAPGPVAESPNNSPGSWTLDGNGWVLDEQQQLLLWLPPDLRDRLILPNMICLISPEGFISLEFQNARLGELWSDCYIPPPTSIGSH